MVWLLIRELAVVEVRALSKKILQWLRFHEENLPRFYLWLRGRSRSGPRSLNSFQTTLLTKHESLTQRR